MKFDQDSYFTKLLYRVDDIKSKTEYILYIADDKVVEMVENMTIDNSWNDVTFEKIYFVSGVNDNIHVHRTLQFTPQMNMVGSRVSGTNKSLEDYRIYTHEVSGKLLKDTLMSTPRTIKASGDKVYIVDSNYVRGAIQYGFELDPSENIYDNSGMIIDAKTNIILSDIVFPKIQKNTKRLIIAGTTTSLDVEILRKMSTNSGRDHDVYDYIFSIYIKNENNYTAKVYFKHDIKFENYTLVDHPEEMHGNSAIWVMNIPRQKFISKRYILSFQVKKNSE